MLHKLIIQYEGLGVSHVRITENITGMIIEWGQLVSIEEWSLSKPVFEVKVTQTLKYDRYPELTDIHDGYGWNLYTLLEFVESLAVE